MDKLILKNFKVFKEETTLELAPITILTGKNSSGKSSVMKALLLLADYLQNTEEQLTLPLNKKFSEKHRINNWENAHNWFSEEKVLSIGYEQEECTFRFDFSSAESDSVIIGLQSFVVDVKELGVRSTFTRRSESEYDLFVPSLLIDQLLNQPQGPNLEELMDEREKVQSKLNLYKKQKEQSSQKELEKIIEEEQRFERRFKMLDREISSIKTSKSEDIKTTMDLNDRNTNSGSSLVTVS